MLFEFRVGPGRPGVVLAELEGPVVDPLLNGGQEIRHSGLEPLQEEALAKADGKRRDQLQGRILEAAVRHNPGGLSESSVQEARSLADRILMDGRCEKDSWVDEVKLPTSGETMYRAATLARVPQELVQESGMELLNSLETGRRESWTERQRLGWTIFSAGILALVVFLIYSFLNAGTKGHMAWPLRIVYLMAFLILCFGLLVLRHRLL